MSPESTKLPNLLYLGPDKAGSTWIYRILDWHPEVRVSRAKEVLFFNNHYDRGLDWYASQFQAGDGREKVVAEVCHDYLFNNKVPQRIFDSLEDVAVMACLREPVDRAFSAYLNMARFGMVPDTFEEAIQNIPGLLEHGRYAPYLRPYVERLGRQRALTPIYDDLVADAGAFASELFRSLGVLDIPLPPALFEKSLPAGRARYQPLAKLAKAGARFAREAGLQTLVSQIKTSPVVQQALYKPFSDRDRPHPAESFAIDLKRRLYDDVAEVDSLLGTNMIGRWRYDELS